MKKEPEQKCKHCGEAKPTHYPRGSRLPVAAVCLRFEATDVAQVQIPEDLKDEYALASYDDEPAFWGSDVREYIERIGRAEAARDRQYEYNVEQIAKQAALEAEIDVLRGSGCEEDGDGPCGGCLKCAERRGWNAASHAVKAVGAVLDEYRQYVRDNDPEVSTGMARLWGAKRVADLVRSALATPEAAKPV
jgi:hypothetical protein